MAELQQIKYLDSSETSGFKSSSFENRGFDDADSFEISTGDTQETERHENCHTEKAEKDALGNPDAGCYENVVYKVQSSVSACFTQHKGFLKNTFLFVLLLLYFAYFAYSLYYRFGDEGSYRLMIATIFATFLLAVYVLRNINSSTEISFTRFTTGVCANKRYRRLASWILKIGVTAALIVYIVVDVIKETPRNLVSLSGLVAFILLFYITSTNPSKVNWQPVFWGIAIQYIFALIILRTSWGYDTFEWIGDRVTEFTRCAAAGADFVFGGLPQQAFFAFYIMPVVVMYCSFIEILYHLGVLQAIIRTIGRMLAYCLGTTPAESLNVAGNMFVGQSEAYTLIHPFLKEMTRSELHAAITAGLASVSGSTLGAYISLGVPANHLLSATVMSAPAALAIAKLSYPETEVSKATSEDFYKIGIAKTHNIVEAAYKGANQSIKLVANICINVIAFLSILKFCNNTLTWFGDRAGVDNLTFEFICSYLMYPLALLMGVDSEDCRKVAELIGVKTFLNEYIAYSTLGQMIDNRNIFEKYTSLYNTTDSWSHVNGDIFLKNWNQTLISGIMTKRSETITTYALCGFSNIAAVGINLGAVLAFAPNRQAEAPKLVVRAMVCGSAACFLTGAVAGLLYADF